MTILIAPNVVQSIREWVDQNPIDPTDPSIEPYASAIAASMGVSRKTNVQPAIDQDWPDFPPLASTKQRALTIDQARAIIANVRFYDWEFTLTEIGEKAGFYLQISADETDNVTGEPMRWKGRKWLVSQFSTNSELIQSCWLAVQIARQHEDRENFFYKDVAVFGPHHDVDDLAARLPRQDLRAKMTPKGQI